MDVEDEFERIARENPDLSDVDWRKEQVYRVDELAAVMPQETFRGAVERLRRGMLHHRLSVAQALEGVDGLPWPIRVNVIYMAGREVMATANDLSVEETERIVKRLDELTEALKAAFDDKPKVEN